MFCRNCSEVLTDTDVVCPRCGFAAGTGTKYCGNCGSPVAPGAVVCEICGVDVSSMAFQQSSPQMQQQSMPYQQQGAPQQTVPPPVYGQSPYPQQNMQQPYGQPQSPYPQQNAQQPYGQSPYGQSPYGQQQTNVYVNMPNTGQGISPKSRVAAGLFGIFLGGFGVHNYYLGYKGKGTAQLLLTLLSCGALGGISGIWGLIEGIMILAGSINHDGEGRQLKN